MLSRWSVLPIYCQLENIVEQHRHCPDFPGTIFQRLRCARCFRDSTQTIDPDATVGQCGHSAFILILASEHERLLIWLFEAD